jgi:hypothetical protein
MAQIYRNYAANQPLLPPASAFFQADLAGTWDVIRFSTGAGAGWFRGKASVDASGNITVTDVLTETGNTTGPPPGTIVWSIDGGGVVSETDEGTRSSFHGNMSSDKQLVIGTSTEGPDTMAIIVARKRDPGVTFNSADLADKTFASHGLLSGNYNFWLYGDGYTDSSGLVTTTSMFYPGGPFSPLPPPDTPQIDANGIVTKAGDPTYYGLMTSDKAVTFMIRTTDVGPPPVYGFTVVIGTGQTFNQADLAGTYDFHGLDSGSPPYWHFLTLTFDTSGTYTCSDFLNSAGNTTLPAGDTYNMDISGAITSPSNPSYHGRMSYNKDMYVRTRTSSGRYGMGIAVK